MPHLVIEYSAPLLPEKDMERFRALLHEALAREKAIDPASIKSRSLAFADFDTGGQGKARPFVHIELRLLTGRDRETLAAIAGRLGRAASEMLPETVECTFELREMARDFYYKRDLAAS
jgi:5-carboxymethyl-2-hydroxymuconate isomerase